MALLLRNKVDGVYEAFSNTLKFRATLGDATLFELTVGQGITLATHGGVASAMALILPSPAQSQLVPLSNAAFYEVVEGAVEAIVLRGPLVGQGD